MLALNDDDRKYFLYLQKHLMLFTNKKYNIYDGFKSIEDFNIKSQEAIQKGIMPIREKMYHAKNLDAFCSQNLNFSREQIEIVKSWRFVYAANFFVLKHLKNETVLITEKEDKLYGVHGISGGLDEFFPSESLPIFINTKLLPFKDIIVYDGFFGYHNIHFGRNISANLKREYNKIKAIQGIISKPEPNTFLSNMTASRGDADIIKYYVKQGLKEEFFPQDAWQLAKKNDENRFVFEQEYAKYFARYEKSSHKKHSEIKPMQFAMYRSCVVGVAETKKVLMEFCKKHYPEIAQYMYIFKA